MCVFLLDGVKMTEQKGMSLADAKNFRKIYGGVAWKCGDEGGWRLVKKNKGLDGFLKQSSQNHRDCFALSLAVTWQAVPYCRPNRARRSVART